jgi:hypothetical protein
MAPRKGTMSHPVRQAATSRREALDEWSMTLILYKLLRGVNPRLSGTGRGVLQRLDLVVHVLPERIVDHGLETPTAGGVGAGPDPLRDMRPGCRPGWPRSWARRWRRRPKYLLEPIG